MYGGLKIFVLYGNIIPGAKSLSLLCCDYSFIVRFVNFFRKLSIEVKSDDDYGCMEDPLFSDNSLVMYVMLHFDIVLLVIL